MSLRADSLRSRRTISLTVRISLLLIAAVVLPLIVTIIGSELILRPTLTSQATAEMQNDAQSHITAIDALLIARLQDLKVLSQYYAIQQYLQDNKNYESQAKSELGLGKSLDVNYNAWTLFDPKGNELLSYPASTGPRGKYATIPPELLAQLDNIHKTVISDVYFDDNLHAAYIDIYTTIASEDNKLIGIARSTLLLTEVWTAVNNETNAATGSYAMIIDGHNVRIAYTNKDTTLLTLPKPLFKPLVPFDSAFASQVKDENLYGNSHAAVSPLTDNTLVDHLQNNTESSYQFTPSEADEAYQAYQVRSQVINWTYVVLRPVNTITGAATQQDTYLIILAAIIMVLAAIVGLVVGRRTTSPILRSLSLLAASSESLKKLAAREQSRAKEQKWIVESAQTGLNSVQYYAKATTVAARKLDEVTQDLTKNWEQLDNVKRQRRIYEIASAASYIEKASGHEERSSNGLSTAIQVTNQVAEQLIEGATSASDAATQLEEVIMQLRQVVGN